MNMTDFKTAIEELSQNCKQYLNTKLDEKKTENWLIEPLIADLGFDIHSPEVDPEHAAGVRDDSDHKVDYALFTNIKDPFPVAIIECKALGTNISKDDIKMQLRQYFQGTKSQQTHVAILTDGNRYLFFTDSENPNLMDAEPYWEFNLSTISNEDIEELAAYSKDSINNTVSGLKDRIEKLKERMFARELKESLSCGSIPAWLVEATENELKNRLNCRLTSSTKQKLEPTIVGMWREIWETVAGKTEDKGETTKYKQLSEPVIPIKDMVTLSSLIKEGTIDKIGIQAYKLGNDPEIAVKKATVSNFMLDCISDLEREDKLLSKFGNELQFASKEKPKHSNHFIEGWFIDTNTPTERKMLQIKEALEKVGRNPEELQLKVCAA